MLHWTDGTHITRRLRRRDSGSNFIFPYELTSDYSNEFAYMSHVRQTPIGTYVAIALRITDVEPNWTTTHNEPFLQLMGVGTEGEHVGPLRLWQHQDGDITAGSAYVVRGLKIANGRMWNDARQMWMRSPEAPKVVECSVRTDIEEVDNVESITCFLL